MCVEGTLSINFKLPDAAVTACSKLCHALLRQTNDTPTELPWSPFDKTPTDPIDVILSPTSKAGRAAPLPDDDKPLIDFREQLE